MISYFNSNPCIAYWYVYWSDVFKMNSDLPGIKGNSDLFDPSVKSSICFTPMGRKATEEFLAKCEGFAHFAPNFEYRSTKWTRLRQEYGSSIYLI